MFPLFTITTHTPHPWGKEKGDEKNKCFKKENLCNKNDKSMKDEKRAELIVKVFKLKENFSWQTENFFRLWNANIPNNKLHFFEGKF